MAHRTQSPSALALLLALLGGLGLTACGVKGDITPAAPLWGDPAREAAAAPVLGEEDPLLAPLVFEDDFDPLEPAAQPLQDEEAEE